MKTSAPALYVGYEHHAFFFSTFFIHNPFLLLRTYYLLLRVCMHALTFLRDFVTFVLSAEIISGRTAWTWGIISSCLVTPSVPSSSSSSSSSVAHKHNVRTYERRVKKLQSNDEHSIVLVETDGRTSYLSVVHARAFNCLYDCYALADLPCMFEHMEIIFLMSLNRQLSCNSRSQSVLISFLPLSRRLLCSVRTAAQLSKKVEISLSFFKGSSDIFFLVFFSREMPHNP